MVYRDELLLGCTQLTGDCEHAVSIFDDRNDPSLNGLVRALKQRASYGQPEGLGSLRIDEELELRRQLDG